MKEIERKWLVDKDRCPGLVLEKGVEKFQTEQGYLNNINDEWLIRVRKMARIGTYINPSTPNPPFYFIELKTQGLLSREELRYYITEKEFLDTIKRCKGGIVRKTRYCWHDNDIYYEVDVYDDHDFVTCEVEFESEEVANRFIAPDWCIKDVTYDSGYKNVNLAV